jgi:DNA mismatch repair protein MutL
MSDIIQLLPDSVANQIAAGEVIQRPASVIKELVENAIDAGATEITTIIKDAGRTLIQVIDNGKGMSETDARMSFERHATSKIRKADDLFAIRSMGFRGEALASMAAIAEVNLQTRRDDDEIGTEIIVRATEVISQEPVGCAKGANFSVKNLFFNVPARRKFLKSDSHEFRLIISELQRIALSNPEVQFKLLHNTTEVFNLTATNHRQRIVQLFGKNINQSLVDIKTDTSLVKLFGYIGKPESAKKSQGEQFFYVNNRFMKHPYFNKAIITAYDRLLANDSYPSYFIYMEVNPENIDVNIHPTKTEIKFEDEASIWQILHATTKEALGKFNIGPSLDFNTEAAIEIPIFNKNAEVRIPTINVNPNFNPFDSDSENKYSKKSGNDDYFKRSNLQHWENLYIGFENDKHSAGKPEETQNSATENQLSIGLTGIMQLKNKFILSPVKSGLMIIDQKRAHEQVLYEEFMNSLSGEGRLSQQSLFPQVVELTSQDHHLLLEYIEDINNSGFDIRDFGNNSVVVNGCPAELENPNPEALVKQMLEEMHSNPQQPNIQAKQYLAGVLSKTSAIPYGKALTNEEMRDLIDKLFACANHNYNPDGKPIISILSTDELEKRLK